MALYDIEDINGVTKVETAIGFVYHFEQVIISTNTALNSMQRTQRGQTTSENVRFINMPDNQGTIDIEGYCDKLAMLGRYKSDPDTSAAVASGIMQSPFELSAQGALNTITEQLEEIKYFIKSIAK